jgi:hypothetical protein
MVTDCWYLVGEKWHKGSFVGLSAGGATVVAGERLQGIPFEVPLTSLSLGAAKPTLSTVSAISPTTGPADGGTAVTVTGTNFRGSTAVNFGAVLATDLIVVSDTSITCISPAGTGAVDVTVVTPGGTSAKVPADQFTYAAAPVTAKVVSHV